MIPNASDADNLAAIQRVYHVDELKARFILAIQRGRIRGDVLPDEQLTAAQRRRLGLGHQIDERNEDA